MPFIVLEGLDGAGKSTQVKLLKQALADRGLEYEYLHFPRFDTPVYGDLIARFLRGELGSVDSVSPYLVGLIYAGDRAAAAPMIRKWLEEGKYVIVDRYVYSNIAYQCAKIYDPSKRMELRRWILDLEYFHNGIPKPDISIFLDVPFSFTETSLNTQREGDDRSYLNGKDDIHERSLDLQKNVREVYLDQARDGGDLQVVVCADTNGKMLAPNVIFQMITEKIGLNG